MAKLFGTDGVRGVANEEITGELAYKLGRAAGYYLQKNFSENGGGTESKPVIFIGKDTRVSGDMLESALVAGITSVGIDACCLGIIPTPGLAFLTSRKETCGGVMISASHNPIADNGIKFFDNRGFKLEDSQEEEIEDILEHSFTDLPYPTHDKIGRVSENDSMIETYIDHLTTCVQGDFSEYKVVLDCANGAAFYAAPRVLEKLGVELIVINGQDDGRKINVNSGSTYPEKIKEKVLQAGADFGIAHDGDADRIVMVNHNGELIDGDKIMAILALDLLKRDQLKGKTLVTTRYSNLGLKEVVEENGGRLKVVKNGDKYVLKEMRKNNYNLGGEKSGHVICLDYNTTGDGILTALQVIEVMNREQKTLQQLASCMKEWPQIMANIEVEDKNSWKHNSRIQKSIDRARNDLGKEGRVFVRASGTEPLIRVMLEGKEKDKLNFWEQELSSVIRDELE
ncbi:MAG: phosphoglucosamine mutase [Halanaerobiaceae bacterium]